HVRALAGEGERDGAPDVRPAARDDDALALEVQLHRVCPLCLPVTMRLPCPDYHAMVCPPSRYTVCPVMKSEAGDARYTASDAASAGSPSRRAGTLARKRSRVSESAMA